MFYLLASMLGLLAAAFAAWPLLRATRWGADDDVEHRIRSLYRARLQEVQSEVEDPALREEMQVELGAVLLSETQVSAGTNSAEASATRPSRSGWWLALLMAVSIPLAGVGLYGLVSDRGLQEVFGAEIVLAPELEDPVALQSWALKLAARVERASDDAKSWYLLGHTYLKLRRFDDAAEAFATTARLSPQDITVQVYWLQARYLAAEGRLDKTGRELADRILAAQPEVPIVIEMLALDALHRGDGQAAVALLNRAIGASGDPRQQASLAAAIGRVRQALADGAPSLTVNVDLAPTAPAAPGHATVFVIARPVGGGMPYAVVRRPAFLMPFDVQLDDLVSMSPTRPLSAAERYEVAVRLSISGAAMAQPEDWSWLSPPLENPLAEALILDALLTPP